LRENIFKAHRKHLFQIMANELMIPHVAVSAIYMVVQAVISAGLIISACHYWYALAVLVVFSVGYVLFMRKFFRLHNQ
jgi:membrane protein implicated in regulation of membrane protease activity